MFRDNSNQKRGQKSPFICLSKRKLFLVSIRRWQQEEIFKKIRSQIILPEDLNELLSDIPQNLREIFRIIQTRDYEQWHFLISQRIKYQLDQDDSVLFDNQHLNNYQKILFFIFLIKNDQDQASFYEKYYGKLIKRGLNWTEEEKASILFIMKYMLKQKHKFVIKDAIEYLKIVKFSRFWLSQLNFYYLLLKEYSNLQDFQLYSSAIFPMNTIIKLSHHVQSSFYQNRQILKMLQILIMLLYISPQENISLNFNIQKLFTSLQSYIVYYKDKTLLIDRVLYLIYNINMDPSSERFVQHNCFQTVIKEMKNGGNQDEKRRALMAELYVNSIYNYPNQGFKQYLAQERKNICQNIDYIIDNFHHIQPIPSILSQLLSYILQFLQTLSDLTFQRQTLEMMMEGIPMLKKHQEYQDVLDRLQKNRQLQ